MADDDDAPVRISYQEAKAKGLVHYFTGIPCKRGHIAIRYVSTTQCAICQMLHRDEYRHKHRENERASAKAYYWTNRETVRAKRNAYDKAYPEKKKARFKGWYDRNRDAWLEYKANDRQANPEVYATRWAKWARANPEAVLANGRRRRARKQGAEGHHTVAEIKLLLKRQRYTCAYCPTSLKSGYHVDHIMSLSKGGTNWISNIQLTCKGCNLMKADKDPLIWARRTGRLL